MKTREHLHRLKRYRKNKPYTTLNSLVSYLNILVLSLKLELDSVIVVFPFIYFSLIFFSLLF